MSDKLEKWIEEALKAEPTFQLRGDFRDRVVKVIRSQERKSQRRFYFYLAFGLIFMIGTGLGLILFYFPGVFSGTSEVAKLLPLAVLVGLLLVVVQYLDQKLVKDKMITPHS